MVECQSNLTYNNDDLFQRGPEHSIEVATNSQTISYVY